MEAPTPSLRDQGVQALQEGSVDRAIDLLARAVMADDQDAEAKAYLGVAYSQKGLHAQAKRALQTANELEPQNANFRFNLGVVLERAGDMTGAAAAYRDTLQIDPGHPQAKARLAAIAPEPAAPSPGAADTGLSSPPPPPPVEQSPTPSPPAASAGPQGFPAAPPPSAPPGGMPPPPPSSYAPPPSPPPTGPGGYAPPPTPGPPGFPSAPPGSLGTQPPGFPPAAPGFPPPPPGSGVPGVPPPPGGYQPGTIPPAPGGYGTPPPGYGMGMQMPLATGEAFGRRLGAWFIDVLLLGLTACVAFPLSLAVGGAVGQGHSDVSGAIFMFVYLFAFAAAHALYGGLMYSSRGQTLGKMACGLRVTAPDGGNPTFAQGALREGSRFVLYFLTCTITLWWMLWDPEQQGLHDKIAGTHVVRA